MIRLAVAALGFAFYVAKLPYVLRAWQISRLDAFDCVFLPLALLVIGWTVWRNRADVSSSCRGRLGALIVLVPTLAGFALGLQMRVNALQIAAAVGIGWSCWWLAYGGRSARAVLPGFAILALTTTSVTYWACNLTGLDEDMVRVAKGALAVLLALTTFPQLRRILLAPALVGVVALGFYIFRSGDLLREGEPFTPAFPAISNERWIVHEEETDAGFRRFFGTSDARQLAYATPSNVVTVLAVKIGANVHEIHPATHCLRTSGWTVHSESVREVEVAGRKLSLAEALVSYDGAMTLSWTWYSDARRSTGSFFCFRRHAGEPGWQTYQLRTSAAGGTEQARAVLVDFLESVRR